MTVAELRRVAEMLSNACWVRHWLNWPAPGRPEYAVMAIHAVEVADGVWRDADVHEPAMAARGFRREHHDGLGWVWVVDRTNEDGSPYRAGGAV